MGKKSWQRLQDLCIMVGSRVFSAFSLAAGRQRSPIAAYVRALAAILLPYPAKSLKSHRLLKRRKG
ncbi:MAG: hypothetical protein AAGU11_05290, partial [Syntrophobacteraceae bacterium]